jgi:hypothetical protein
MDGRKRPLSPSDLDGRNDADAAPADSVRENSPVTDLGRAQHISEGFAIALRATGFETGILPSDITQSHTTSNPEEN